MTKRRSQHSTLILCAIFLLVGALSLTTPATAAAQDDATISAEDLEKAEAHFAKGAQYFAEKRYSSAIVEFLSAYKYKPDPMLQYNISVAHARLGNIEEAHKAARRAAAGGIPQKAMPVNAARIQAWASALRARGVSESINAARQAQAEREAVPAQDTPLSVDNPAPSPSAGLSALGWSGVAASAVGVGLLGYATYVELSMSEDIDAYKSAAKSPTPAEYDAYQQDLSDRQSLGLIALYSGAALSAAGLGLLTYDLLGDGQETASIDLSPGVDGATVRLIYLFK